MGMRATNRLRTPLGRPAACLALTLFAAAGLAASQDDVLWQHDTNG